MKPYYNIPNICSEILFPGSVIDGTALALSEYCREKNNPVFTLFCIESYHYLLELSVQAKSLEAYKLRLDQLYKQFLDITKDRGLGTN